MSDAVRDPCGNEDCDKCNPLPRFKVSTERVQRLFYEREIKAKDEAEALRIYNEGTAWPTQYDDRYGEILEEHAPVITVEEPRDKRYTKMDCFHNLPSVLHVITSCDFVGDQGCSDEECPRCHPKHSGGL
jgi:hypothetical protein